MHCKFDKIKPLPLGDFRVWFIVNGQHQSLSYSDISDLMEAVLNDDDFNGPSEWDQWCENGILPDTYGHLEPFDTISDLEFAKRYFKDNEDTYELCFIDD